MERAKQLLLTTDLSLAAVSEAVGFNDYFYFLRVHGTVSIVYLILI